MAPGPTPVEPPTVTVPEEDVPLTPPALPIWALLNLILAILGGLIAIMLLVTAIRRKQDEYDEYEDTPENRRLKALWRILGILGGIAGIVTFVLTENIHNVMVLTDRWTLLMVIIEFAVLIFTFLAFRRSSDKDSDDGAKFEMDMPGDN
jgi:heme/copper-type cytochrome/quinol oxidase subunit 2